MKLGELKALIDDHLKRHPRDAEEKEVVIKTQNGGIPTHYMAPIVGAAGGFDWTAGYYLLTTKDPMVVFKNTFQPSIKEYGRTILEQIKGYHAKLGYKYIPKAREEEWLDGFFNGVREFTIAVEAITKSEK